MAQKSIPAIAFAFLVIVLFCITQPLKVQAQALSAGTVSGTIVDPNEAIVPNATVTISNPAKRI